MTRKSDDFEIEIEPKDEKNSQYVIDEEDSSKKSEELLVKLDKLMDRLKLITLEVDKKSADLEIKIGKLEERFKDVIYDFPKLKERIDSVEDQMHVVNLGLMDFKKQVSDVDSRVSNLEKAPSTVEERIASLENKIKNIDEDVQKIHPRLGEIESIKKDVARNVEGIVGAKEAKLTEAIDNNKTEIENMKKNVDALSFAVKSFERTIQLTNLDDMIKRFDSLDRRIMDLEIAVQKLRSDASRESVITQSDVEVFKERLKEISTTVMNALDRMNKFEMIMNSKLIKTEELSKSFERIEALKSVTDDVREQVKIMREVQASVQDLYEKIIKIYDSGKIGWDRIQNVAREMSDLEKAKTDIEDLRKIVEWLVSKNETRLI